MPSKNNWATKIAVALSSVAFTGMALGLIGWGAMAKTIEVQAEVDKDHEKRIRSVEEDLGEIKGDMKVQSYILRALGEKEGITPPPELDNDR